jgi:hypothetical protein
MNSLWRKGEGMLREITKREEVGVTRHVIIDLRWKKMVFLAHCRIR